MRQGQNGVQGPSHKRANICAFIDRERERESQAQPFKWRGGPSPLSLVTLKLPCLFVNKNELSLSSFGCSGQLNPQPGREKKGKKIWTYGKYGPSKAPKTGGNPMVPKFSASEND